MEGFLPGRKYGGPPISVKNFCSLMNEHDIYIIARNHDLGEKTIYPDIYEGWNSNEFYNVKYLSDEGFNVKSFEDVILEIKPDRIYLQSLFQSCIWGCLYLAKKYKIQVILAPRGELCDGAMRKKYKKLPYITALRVLGLFQNVIYQSTSDDETLGIRKWLKAKNKDIFLVDNIPSVLSNSDIFADKESGNAKFVFISRIHPKKNLLMAIKLINKVSDDVTFDIYGPMEDKSYWEKCKKEIEKAPNNVKINYCGIVDHSNVHTTFKRYDAFLFPTFSENYGHVIVESLIAGCPVITSDKTPWQDLESNGAGWAIELENENAYMNAIKSVFDAVKILEGGK